MNAIGKIQILILAVVLLGTVFVMGGLRPYHRDDSYLLTGIPVILVEIALALAFARGRVLRAVSDNGQRAWIRSSLTGLVMLVAAAMPPTVMILFANQALDGSPGVEETLPVTRTYSSHSRGSTTYYAEVPARAPPRRLFAWSETQESIVIPHESWQRLVAGQSTMTLKVHPGRFGLPWYDIVGMTM